ncbi:MAG: hypothetical protein AAGF10_06080 [Verrucomicrobiota bacterium]
MIRLSLNFRRLLALVLLACSGLLVSCDDENLPYLPAFYLEMGKSFSSFDKSTEYTLPVSEKSYMVFSEPIVPPWSVSNVEAVRVESGLLALRFYFDRVGDRDLYRNSVTNMGRMIITVVDGEAIGARQIDGALQGGVFYTFTELSDAEVMEMLPKMQESIRKLNELKRDR